jgi:hypothetical protein
MARHPNKHIREAIKYAETRGWRFQKASGHAHIFGELLCPFAARGGCIIRVFSTPRVPEEHAARIRREVDACRHDGEDDVGRQP